jgi:hypothetical protein
MSSYCSLIVTTTSAHKMKIDEIYGEAVSCILLFIKRALSLLEDYELFNCY